MATFEKKLYIELTIDQIQMIHVHSLKNVIAEATHCKVEVYKDKYGFETGQCYIVSFQEYDTQHTLDEIHLKHTIQRFCKQSIKANESEISGMDDEIQVPIRFEHNGGKLI